MNDGKPSVDAVLRKEDLRVEFAHHAGGGADPRVRLVNERTGRVLVALPPAHAAMLGEALHTFATNAAKTLAQIERGRGGTPGGAL